MQHSLNKDLENGKLSTSAIESDENIAEEKEPYRQASNLRLLLKRIEPKFSFVLACYYV